MVKLEKAVARRAFEHALKGEFERLIVETKRRAAEIEQIADVWSLAEYILDGRKEIDSRYDYRYSVLPSVLADLLRTGRIHESDLAGLNGDKLAEIRRLVKVRS
jgi:hypothetical protein